MRYIKYMAAAMLLVGLELTAAQEFDLDYVEDAHDIYLSYLDSLSYYVPDAVLKLFFTGAAPSSELSRSLQTCSEAAEAKGCIVTSWKSSTFWIMLHVGVLAYALPFGVLIIATRSILRNKVGKSETNHLIHREQSDFGRGPSLRAADRHDTVGNEEDEQELDATPGHLHAIMAKAALMSDPEAKHRCCAEHRLSASPLSFNEDILLDKSGLDDVPCPPSPKIQKETLESIETLVTVPERMCEDSLDDAHAFCDAQSKNLRGYAKTLSKVDECSDELERSSTSAAMRPQ